ncbi:hypothetical protein C8T65DRAFT_50175 [Cerioporus squamosus]|nr:hypothetical protein C8T65DRAFT_50175 [Cerioporus squamosus]
MSLCPVLDPESHTPHASSSSLAASFARCGIRVPSETSSGAILRMSAEPGDSSLEDLCRGRSLSHRHGPAWRAPSRAAEEWRRFRGTARTRVLLQVADGRASTAKWEGNGSREFGPSEGGKSEPVLQREPHATSEGDRRRRAATRGGLDSRYDLQVTGKQGGGRRGEWGPAPWESVGEHGRGPLSRGARARWMRCARGSIWVQLTARAPTSLRRRPHDWSGAVGMADVGAPGAAGEGVWV